MSTRGRVVSALKWTTVAQASQRLVSWAVTLVVIRLLSPTDYGLMAISLVLIRIAGLLNDLGLNAALIQKHRLDPHLAPKIYGAVLLSNALALVLVQVAAQPFADFYGDAAIDPITRVLSLTLVFGAVASVPMALLLRKIEFRTVSLLEIGTTLVSSLLVLWLAWSGWGVWALVYGALASSILQAGGIVLVTKMTLRPNFNLTGLGSELRFGTFVLAKSFVATLNQNVGSLLIGRLLGIAPLGVFQVADDVAKMPVRALLRPVARVAFPTVARLQDDLGRVQAFYLRSTSGLLLVLLPVCWGIAMLSGELVALLLGSKWNAAAPLLAVISVFVPLRAISRLMQSALDGIGRPEVGLANLLTITVCVVPAIVVGARWGLMGVAIAWCAGQLLGLLANLQRSLPAVNMTWRMLADSFAPPLLAAAVMCGGVWLARMLLGDVLPLLLRTLTLVGIGVVVYIGATLLVNRQRALAAVRQLREAAG